MDPVSLHPAAAILAHSILSASNPGSVAGMRSAMKALDRIVEKAHPADPWPNPWALYTDEQAKAIASEMSHPIDPEARVAIAFTQEEIDVLRSAVEEYAGKAPAIHAHPLVHILDALPGKE